MDITGHRGYLRYDGDVSSELMKTHILCVQTINLNQTKWLCQSEESRDEGRLACSCPTNNTNLKV